MARVHGQVVNTEHSGGLGVQDWWAETLRANEIAFREKKYDNVLLDSQLADRVRAAFPDRVWSKSLVNVSRARAEYNRGEWTGEVPPVIQSYRYGRDEGALVRLTPRGKVIWRQPRGSLKKLDDEVVERVDKPKTGGKVSK